MMQKVIKAEHIRKRRNIDNAVPSSKSKLQHRSEQLPKRASESTWDDGSRTPVEKVKISDQLIKKLSDDSKSDDKDDIKKEEKEEKREEKSVNETPAEAAKPMPSEEKEAETSTTDEEKKSEASSKSAKEKSSSDDDSSDKIHLVTSIINIIHSLLNKSKPGVSMLKKCKASDEDEVFPPNKMVKLVPIENILKKTAEPITTSRPTKKSKEFMVLKTVWVIKDAKEQKNKQVTPQSIVIKDEVTSDKDNDDGCTGRKRQLFSAGTSSPSNTASSASKGKSKEIYIKPLSRMETAKHKAQRSFPRPNYSKKIVTTSSLQPLHPGNSPSIMPKLHYTKPPPLVPSEPIITLIQKPTNTTSSFSSSEDSSSQNCIPHNEQHSSLNNGSLPNNLLSGRNVAGVLPISGLVPVSGVTTITTATAAANTTEDIPASDESMHAIKELDELRGILLENVSKGVTEIFCKPLPRLKPKPSGALSAVVCEPSVPSIAGPASSRINTVGQKLGDHFRGLLVETVTDLGKSDNAEATISSLKLEIEELKHRHAIESAEISRKVSTVLKDIQKSVVEERERIVSDVRAKYEAETAKKVEEAKSKQWCANCMKEAQFYCCWNTSYCDYPCQQKHWTTHMNKCTRNTNQDATTTATVRSPGQQ